jgi:hypothetical protein
MGFTSRRPKDFPAIDRGALMRDAHLIARNSRGHFQNYRAAMAHGLRVAWMTTRSRRQIQSLAAQVVAPAVPFTAAQIEASRRATRRCGASLSAS